MCDKPNLLVPIAGLAQRFADAGYTMPKPLIMVYNSHIIDFAMSSIDLEEYDSIIFVVRKEHIRNFSIDEILKSKFNNVKIVATDENTGGSVETCMLASEHINNNNPLVVYTPDVYFEPPFSVTEVIEKNVDGFVLTFKANNPAHSYVRKNEDGLIYEAAEKRVISDRACVGVYYFRSGRVFCDLATSMIREDVRTKGEFYICPMYDIWLKRHPSNPPVIVDNLVEKMHVLGTPEDLEFFQNRVLTHKFIFDRPIGLCADHSGFALKEDVKDWFNSNGIKHTDFGTYSDSIACDYADFAHEAIDFMNRGMCNIVFGFCRTGQGMNICANKHDGVFSALVHNSYTAEHAIRHNCANFFAIPSLNVSITGFRDIFQSIVGNNFDGGRHLTRIRKFCDV